MAVFLLQLQLLNEEKDNHHISSQEKSPIFGKRK
jgi:hypothetical protein